MNLEDFLKLPREVFSTPHAEEHWLNVVVMLSLPEEVIESGKQNCPIQKLELEHLSEFYTAEFSEYLCNKSCARERWFNGKNLMLWDFDINLLQQIAENELVQNRWLQMFGCDTRYFMHTPTQNFQYALANSVCVSMPEQRSIVFNQDILGLVFQHYVESNTKTLQIHEFRDDDDEPFSLNVENALKTLCRGPLTEWLYTNGMPNQRALLIKLGSILSKRYEVLHEEESQELYQEAKSDLIELAKSASLEEIKEEGYLASLWSNHLDELYEDRHISHEMRESWRMPDISHYF